MSQQTTTATNRASVMHAIIHAWYMSGLISRSVYIAIATLDPEDCNILELHCNDKISTVDLWYIYGKSPLSVHRKCNNHVLVKITNAMENGADTDQMPCSTLVTHVAHKCFQMFVTFGKVRIDGLSLISLKKSERGLRE